MKCNLFLLWIVDKMGKNESFSEKIVILLLVCMKYFVFKNLLKVLSKMCLLISQATSLALWD